MSPARDLAATRIIIQLIASTTTQTGLTVQAGSTRTPMRRAPKVSDEQIASLNITVAEVHGDWNHTIAPRKPIPDAVILSQTLNRSQAELILGSLGPGGHRSTIVARAPTARPAAMRFCSSALALMTWRPIGNPS